jgi:hypothetical protein
LKGKRTLDNFKYRNAILDIEMNGYGSSVKSFSIDGKKSDPHQVPSTLQGKHKIQIVLAGNELPSKIHSVADIASPQMPVSIYNDGAISWTDTSSHIVSYKVIRNGKLWKETAEKTIKPDTSHYGSYQVIAVARNGNESFASEPLQLYPKENEMVIQAESIVPASGKHYQGFWGTGFIEISKTGNREINLTFNAKEDGTYLIDVRYANGNGPVNTENKCAFRSLIIDNQPSGTLVFPQRGKEEWSNWGWSNSREIYLTKGLHHFSIRYEVSNENMNGDINQAMLDCIRLIKT